MIGVSDTFVRLFNYTDLVQNDGNIYFYVFTGTEPTAEQIAEIKALDVDGRVRVNHILDWASARGDTLLHARAFDNIEPDFPNNKLVQFSLVDRTEEFYQLNEGNIGWFVFAKSNDTQSLSNINISNIGDSSFMTQNCLVSYFGNAGDEESEADIGIFSGFVDTDREYTMTDFEVAYV